MSKKKLLKVTILINCLIFVFLCGCRAEPPVTIENNELVDYQVNKNIYTSDMALSLAESVLSEKYKSEGVKVTYSDLVNFNDFTDMYFGKYYKFDLEKETEKIDNYLLVNQETGVVLSCYDDGSFKQVRKDDNFKSDEVMWQGNYYKVLDENYPENSYSLISIAKETDNNIYVTTNTYMGSGVYKMYMNCQLEGNRATYTDEFKTVEFILNEDNSINCTVIEGEQDVIDAIDGLLL